MFADLRTRLRTLVRRSTVERELDAELRFHVEQQIEQLMNAGLDRDEATRRARLVFGGLDQIKEECRDARGTRFIEELRRDVHYAVRMMQRRTLSTATAIATVAVGIGLNAAVFSLVDWVLLRPLPYPAADELVKVQSLGSGTATGGQPDTCGIRTRVDEQERRSMGCLQRLDARAVRAGHRARTYRRRAHQRRSIPYLWHRSGRWSVDHASGDRQRRVRCGD
jgi:macrolide transport system ATP-binding/permease protein